MPYFLCRLNGPHPNFAFDMSEDERALMQTHAGYWHDLVAKGSAVLFGPVFDPKGPWASASLRPPTRRQRAYSPTAIRS